MTFRFGRYAFGIGLATALLAACGGASNNPPLWNSMSGPFRNVPFHSMRAGSTSRLSGFPPSVYKVVYGFASDSSDGRYPVGGLIKVNGSLYGTTSGGGAYGHLGTVFSVSTSGKEKVLHSFGHGTDGASPLAGLIDVDGTLYGTTSGGGTLGKGTVFSITTTGDEKVLHSFGRGHDGETPEAGLIDMDGMLYGTTYLGGVHVKSGVGEGTVFSITTAGAEKVLHRFGKGTDGINPVASLINVNGTLYGTTLFGGAHGGGTVFSIATTGTEKVLHSFGEGSDGEIPGANLINVKGTLYSTTESGGAYGQSGSPHDGTVFSITTTGAEKVLHSFGKDSDGIFPVAGLIDLHGTLYGTTFSGGAYSECGPSGYSPCGTVFSIGTTGKEKVLHSFGKGGGADGVRPDASFINLKGTLYGTTFRGGAHDRGTVFALKP